MKRDFSLKMSKERRFAFRPKGTPKEVRRKKATWCVRWDRSGSIHWEITSNDIGEVTTVSANSGGLQTKAAGGNQISTVTLSDSTWSHPYCNRNEKTAQNEPYFPSSRWKRFLESYRHWGLGITSWSAIISHRSVNVSLKKLLAKKIHETRTTWWAPPSKSLSEQQLLRPWNRSAAKQMGGSNWSR